MYTNVCDTILAVRKFVAYELRSQIQEYEIFTRTKISAITVVSPHLYPVTETINPVFSQFVSSVLLHVDRFDEHWNESTKRKIVITCVSDVLRIFILLQTSLLFSHDINFS